jgi:hypothetical protein
VAHTSVVYLAPPSLPLLVLRSLTLLLLLLCGAAQGSALKAAVLKGVSSPDEVITPPTKPGWVDPAIQLEFSHDLKFAGTLEDCNRALGSLFYRGDPNWNSANKDKDVVTFRVTELLTAGAGVPTTDVRVMYITVVSVNDAPVVHVPGASQASTCGGRAASRTRVRCAAPPGRVSGAWLVPPLLSPPPPPHTLMMCGPVVCAPMQSPSKPGASSTRTAWTTW